MLPDLACQHDHILDNFFISPIAKAADPAVVLQSLGHSFKFASRAFEQHWEGLTEWFIFQPATSPKFRRLAVSDGNPRDSREEGPVIAVTRGWESFPWPILLHPFQPKPSET
jgi:hypothetical protein